jgi:membrane associated rhomboid family serine protease
MPSPFPAWLYAILFFAGSFFALKRQADNIGHDAHLGGIIDCGLRPAWAGDRSLQPKMF